MSQGCFRACLLRQSSKQSVTYRYCGILCGNKASDLCENLYKSNTFNEGALSAHVPPSDDLETCILITGTDIVENKTSLPYFGHGVSGGFENQCICNHWPNIVSSCCQVGKRGKHVNNCDGFVDIKKSFWIVQQSLLQLYMCLITMSGDNISLSLDLAAFLDKLQCLAVKMAFAADSVYNLYPSQGALLPLRVVVVRSSVFRELPFHIGPLEAKVIVVVIPQPKLRYRVKMCWLRMSSVQYLKCMFLTYLEM